MTYTKGHYQRPLV